jgi:hypothetical protein
VKVLVAAPYPTMGGPASTETVALVRDLVAAGDEVEVAAPMVSAAHHVADLGGVRGALTLARLVPRFDRIVVRLDATALAADAAVVRLLPARLALAAALRRAPAVELTLDRVPPRIDRQFARLVLSFAREITVAGGEEVAVIERAGIDAARIRLSDVPRHQATRVTDAAAPWRLSAGPSRQELQAAVRSRAAVARSGDAGGSGPVAMRPSSEPVRQIDPLGAAEAASPKPGVAVLKRLFRRLTGWQVDPVIRHVNQLQNALVTALDQLEARAESSSRGKDL